MKNREIKFRIWFDEPCAPPQMIYPHIDDFIYNKDGNAIGRAFLDCDYQKGLKVYYQVVMNTESLNRDTLGLLDNTQNEAINSILMEYSGLRDKNNIELYEGDIVKFDDSSKNYLIEYVEGKFYGSWQSKWNADSDEMIVGEYGRTNWFRWDHKGRNGDFGIVVERATNFEIIGNKYENPELLIDGQTE